MQDVNKYLENNNITLPAVAAPAANYVSHLVHDGQLFISGQLPLADGALTHTGKVTDVKAGQAAARQCAINILAQIQAAVQGDWSVLDRMIRIGVFVNANAGFTDAHLVANGASDLLVGALGDKGKHIRAAVCCSELPLGASVEVEALARLKL